MPFENPIVAKETLVIPAIQSEGYVAGVSGWRIERDGDAELNDATVRGALRVDDGTRSITIDTPGSLAQILFEILGVDIARISINSSISPPEFRIDGFEGGGDNSIHIRITPDSQRIQITCTTGTASDDLRLFLEAADNVRLSRFLVYAPTNGGGFNPPETFHDVSLQNGWTNFGGGYPNLRYRWMPDGMVAIEGTIAPGTTTNGTVIGTLPVGYRPSNIKRLQWLELGALGFVDIQTNGNIQIYGSAGIVTASFSNQFALGDIF